MTTIIPDTASEEGAKLVEYKPGDRVELTFTVESTDGRKLTVTDETCELAEPDETEEAAAGDEAEAEPAPIPAKGGPAKALMMVAGKTGRK